MAHECVADSVEDVLIRLARARDKYVKWSYFVFNFLSDFSNRLAVPQIALICKDPGLKLRVILFPVIRTETLYRRIRIIIRQLARGLSHQLEVMVDADNCTADADKFRG